MTKKQSQSQQQTNEKKPKKENTKDIKETKEIKQNLQPNSPRKITLSRKTLERLEESFSAEEINELKEIINSPRQHHMKMLDEVEMKKISSSLSSYSKKSKHNSKDSLKRKSSESKKLDTLE